MLLSVTRLMRWLEPAHLAVERCAHHQAGSRGPEHIGSLGAVVLAMVVLDGREQAAAAVGVAMLVEIAARRAGIVEDLPAVVAVLQHLGLHSTHLRVLVHVAVQRLEPALRCAHVAVEQHRVLVARSLGDALVVALGIAVVLVEQDGGHLRELLFKHLAAGVGAAIVGHDHVGHVGVGVLEHSRQVAAQQRRAVPVQYDYGNILFHTKVDFSVSISLCVCCPGSCTGRFQRSWVHSHIEGHSLMLCSSRRA